MNCRMFDLTTYSSLKICHVWAHGRHSAEVFVPPPFPSWFMVPDLQLLLDPQSGGDFRHFLHRLVAGQASRLSQEVNCPLRVAGPHQFVSLQLPHGIDPGSSRGQPLDPNVPVGNAAGEDASLVLGAVGLFMSALYIEWNLGVECPQPQGMARSDPFEFKHALGGFALEPLRRRSLGAAARLLRRIGSTRKLYRDTVFAPIDAIRRPVRPSRFEQNRGLKRNLQNAPRAFPLGASFWDLHSS
ncbi:hypothetical protein SAMN05444166_4664 [Singulisphaera sp. GP187]|nr:hypothetical protein SAMN05444166_4664 [Singulisphaera sp. GP187]